MRKRLNFLTLLLTIFTGVAQLYADELSSGTWSGELTRTETNCRSSQGSYVGSNTTTITGTFTQAGSTVTFTRATDAREFPQEPVSAEISDGSFTLVHSFDVDDDASSVGFSYMCAGSVSLNFEANRTQAGYYTRGKVTYIASASFCPGSTISWPCQSIYTGTLKGPGAPDDPASTSIRARISGSFLTCKLKSDGEEIADAPVLAQVLKAGGKKFRTLRNSAVTNSKGAARFNLAKVKRGSKLRCAYEDSYSSEVTFD